MNILTQKGFSRALAKAVNDLKEDAYEHGYERDQEWMDFIWELEQYSNKLTADFERNFSFGMAVSRAKHMVRKSERIGGFNYEKKVR